ncbi:hypothetical protein FHL15_000420 [Xylaria flabelliformis]|uniref:Uncharacterized protein n=1 Tax=Xylaria flabelliformis TaxID=2512241 RepID=A0A553IFW4_9PEZI|nr:hypothetical protein FHL15_000420 [Xylaria flabelliformis]
MRRKIKVKDCTDEKIVEIYKEEAGLSCKIPRWIDVEDVQVNTSECTAAIAVDMSTSRGHVRVFDKRGEQVDMVGQSHRGHTVILWVGDGYEYDCFGPCRIATLERE